MSKPKPAKAPARGAESSSTATRSTRTKQETTPPREQQRKTATAQPAGKTAATRAPRKAAATGQPAEAGSTLEKVTAPLTPAEQTFQKLLRECLPQERKFIQHKLARKNNTEAAILAGYSERTAEEQGARLLGRVRVWDAYQAGLDASGFGPREVLDDIRALRTFDRSQIEREIKERATELVERRAEDVIQELLTRERAVQDMLDGVDREDDEELWKSLKARLRVLLRDRLQLQEDAALNPDALVIRREERLITKRVIDYDLARERGLLRFIKGVKPTKYGDVIELHDWVDGVDMAARAHGVFKDRKVLENPDGGPLTGGLATVIVLPSNGREDR